MATHIDCYAPVGWVGARDPQGALVTGAWEKELRRPPRGDGFSLIQLEAGVSWETAAGTASRMLVLEGEVEITTDAVEPPHRARRGAYVAVGETALRLSSSDGTLMLLISGDHLGDPVENIWSPGGWFKGGPGLWARPLLTQQLDGEFDERVAGVAYFEPGGAVDLHHHATAHLFLFLDGEADDEVVYPDGTRDVALRRRGDFVEYPFPVEHRSSSRTGCTILFVHEPVSARWTA